MFVNVFSILDCCSSQFYKYSFDLYFAGICKLYITSLSGKNNVSLCAKEQFKSFQVPVEVGEYVLETEKQNSLCSHDM